jgi:hypothetical protein
MTVWSGEMLTILENCKKLLAHQLYSAFRCTEDPRAECDWKTACLLLEKNPYLINIASGCLAASGWFTFDMGFNMQTTLIDSGGFSQLCWARFWKELRYWSSYLPRGKYRTAQAFD